MTQRQRSFPLVAALAALAATALVAACGGDDRDDTPATSAVPQSASDSPDGFIDYLTRLVAASDDTLEPVDTGAVTPPSNDTAEPRQVD